MANYPNQDPAFSDKSPGQTIASAHMDAVQDEIVAIGSALRGTLQHNLTVGSFSLNVGGNSTLTGAVNAGNSTVATLSVTGGSTLAGALTVTGGSTFAVRPVMPPPDAVSLTGSTTPLANNSSAGFAWPTQTFALNSSIHSTSSNPDRLTPQSTGVYAISATVQLAGNFSVGSTSNFIVTVKDSSGTVIALDRVGSPGQTNPTASVMTLKRFDVVGGYLRVVGVQRSGSTDSASGALSFLNFWKL